MATSDGREGPSQRNPAPTGGAKILAWRSAGLVSLALGVVGILLPLLPTTPFLLLAAFCFSRGSERLQKWLLEHPRLGPPIRDWREHRAISRKAKGLAALAMILVLVATVLLRAPATVLVTQLVVMVPVGAFVFTRPSSR
jgi:uncharacterized membrane protein YbaN (DUF454 family)